MTNSFLRFVLNFLVYTKGSLAASFIGSCCPDEDNSDLVDYRDSERQQQNQDTYNDIEHRRRYNEAGQDNRE